jgi:hypothetical protein
MAYTFGPDTSAETGKSFGQYFIIGRVKNIVYGQFINGTRILDPDYKTPADVGKIGFEMLYSALPVSINNNISKNAHPIYSFVKQFPLVGEIVLIIIGPSSKLNDSAASQNLFYFPPYALWNSVHQNAFPNMYEYRDYVKKAASQPGYQGSTATGAVQSFPLGATFKEKENIRNLKIFEGDSLLESRFGQSIRFGSTVLEQKKESPWSNTGNDGDPIVIIRNGQGTPNDPNKFSSTVENINRDKSSIYLTAGQEVVLEDINNFPLSSFGTGIDPQVERFNSIPVKPISNEIVSAADQDKKTQGK